MRTIRYKGHTIITWKVSLPGTSASASVKSLSSGQHLYSASSTADAKKWVDAKVDNAKHGAS